MYNREWVQNPYVEIVSLRTIDTKTGIMWEIKKYENETVVASCPDGDYYSLGNVSIEEAMKQATQIMHTR